MTRRMQTVYVETDRDAKLVDAALKKLKATIKSLNWDGEWDDAEEDICNYHPEEAS